MNELASLRRALDRLAAPHTARPAPEPRSGWYRDQLDRRWYVVKRSPTSVYAGCEDDHFTCADFATFASWGWTFDTDQQRPLLVEPLPEKRAL